MRMRMFLLVGMAVLAFARLVFASDEPGLNARQAAILCTIYNAATNHPKSVYNTEDVTKITAQIDAINASLGPEDWFDEIEKADTQDKLGESFKAQNGEIAKYWGRWKGAVRQVTSSGFPYPRLLVDSPVTKMARIKLKKIENRVSVILNDIQSKNSSTKLDEIRTKFGAAVGEEGKVAFAGSNRVTACGKAAGTKGDDAGKNLILDFMCLCADENDGSNGKGNACFGDGPVVQLRSREAFSSYAQTADKVDEMWKIVKTQCRNQPYPKPTKAVHLRAALASFFHELNRVNTGYTTAKIGVLGNLQGNGGTGCDGKYNSAGGPCVMYSQTARNNNYQVLWYDQIKDVPELLEKVENTTVAIHLDITQLKILQTNAEEIYDEAKAILELEKVNPGKPTQNQSQKQNQLSSTDKTTAQDHTAVSTATTRRYILPWTLLI